MSEAPERIWLQFEDGKEWVGEAFREEWQCDPAAPGNAEYIRADLQQWVPVTEALPDADAAIFWGPNFVRPNLFYRHTADGFHLHGATHWQPLPQPPEATP